MKVVFFSFVIAIAMISCICSFKLENKDGEVVKREVCTVYLIITRIPIF